MNKNIGLTITALICLLVLTTCNKKQHAIDNLSDFVEEVKKNAPEYTDKDWEEADKKYDEIIAEIDKYDYSSKEAERIAELKGKYVGIKTKESAKDLIDSVEKTLHEVKGSIKGFKDGILGNKMLPHENEIDSSVVNN